MGKYLTLRNAAYAVIALLMVFKGREFTLDLLSIINSLSGAFVPAV